MSKFAHDFRQALGGLFKSPTYALLSILMLSVGLGSTLFMFSVINSWILKPLPFHEASRLMLVERTNYARGVDRMSARVHDFIDWREQQTSFKGIAAFSFASASISDGDHADRYDGAFITANTFEILRVQPQLGRDLSPTDERPGSDDVVIISHRLWQQRYNADPGIIGREIRVNAMPTTVVGVMPEGFQFPRYQDAWLPMQHDLADFSRGDGPMLTAFGRLDEGISRAQAQQEMDVIAGRIAEAHPDSNANIGVTVVPYSHEYVSSDVRALLWTMFAAVITVLIIACANVANLTLARTTVRRRELSIRSAMGASRSRLLGFVLIELLVLSVVSIFIAYWLAEMAGAALDNYWAANAAPVPYWITHSIDWRYVLFAAAAVVVSALVSGLLPALRATRVDVNASLKEGGHGTTGSTLGWVARALVVGQISLSCMLLVGAGLMARSLANLNNVDVGVSTGQIYTARLNLFEETHTNETQRRAFFNSLAGHLEAVPGAVGVALSTSLPGTFTSRIKYGESPSQAGDNAQQPMARDLIVSPGFFETLDIPIFAGRGFDTRDRPDALPVAIVNRRLADLLWPESSAVGRQLWVDDNGGEWLEIVGVVGDVVYQENLGNRPRATIYRPLNQADTDFAHILIQTIGDPMAIAERVRHIVSDLNADIALYWIRPLNEWIAAAAFVPRLLAMLFSLFAGIAMALAATGLFAVVSYSINQRTEEIGLRRTLGATNTRIAAIVFSGISYQLAIGIGVGLVLAFGFSQLLSYWLVGVSVLDAITFSGVAGILAVVAIIATGLPLARALRVNPSVALRHE